MTVKLCAMHDSQFAVFLSHMTSQYAQSLLRCGEISEQLLAEKTSTETIATMLPDGVKTLGHMLSTIVVDTQTVGWLWYKVEGHLAHLCYITIHEAYRRQGYAVDALVLMEHGLRDIGVQDISLFVYQFNPEAKQLYDKLGYTVFEEVCQDGSQTVSRYKMVKYL